MPTKTGFIAKETIERILQATDIVQLIGGYVRLKGSGKNYLGLCPFHNERTPSFVVSPARQNYHCYGCGAFGDALRFLMEKENYRFQEALLFLADRCGIEIRKKGGGRAASGLKPKLAECLGKSFDYYVGNLKSAKDTDPIREYIRQRRVPHELAERFALGYAKPGWSNLHDFLNRNRIDSRLQDSAGLIKKGDSGRFYDRLRNRLIFPIRDAQGRILGFAGRAIADDLPKYLNPPETGLYKKGNILYGLYEANETIRRRKRVIVVEGYLDALRLHEHGWTESVATCGTALNEGHIRLLKRLNLSDVVLLFDGDHAGVQAADRSARLFIENDVDCTVVTLPEGVDPDDYFHKHSDRDFQSLLSRGRKDFDFIIDRVRSDSGSTGIERQRRSIEGTLELGSKIGNPIKRDLFLSKVASAFHVQKSSIAALRGRAAPPARNEPQVAGGKNDSRNGPEENLIRYLIKQVRSMEKVRRFVCADDFDNNELGALYERLTRLSDEEFRTLKLLDFPNLYVEHSSLLMSLMQTGKVPRTDAFSEKVLDEIILRFKRQQIARLLHHANQAENETEERRRVNRIRELRSSIDHLNHRNKKQSAL